jgi:hypothetical protein
MYLNLESENTITGELLTIYCGIFESVVSYQFDFIGKPSQK